jgi:hypothetical protein
MSAQFKSVLKPQGNVAALPDQSPVCPLPGEESADRTARRTADRANQASRTGRLIVNADDWGRDRNTTDRIKDCCLGGSVSAVSAMVFMEDSERAAEQALEHGIDAGLHLNFTTRFSAPACPGPLLEHQQRVAGYLLRRRINQVVFHPGLARSFAYVAAAQREEFCRLYGAAPNRVDGHHHMHLSANVLVQGLLPRGIVVRRNFSFQPGEKSFVNRSYRKAVDFWLGRRHRLTDFLFSVQPLEDQVRLRRILGLAQTSVVELETHPVNPEEYRFLTGSSVIGGATGFPIEPRFAGSLSSATEIHG